MTARHITHTERMTEQMRRLFVAAHGFEPTWNKPPRKRRVYKMSTTYSRMATGPDYSHWVSAKYFPDCDFWSVRGPKGMAHGRTPEDALEAWNAIEATQ
jgi:hypothetical protein